MNTRLLTLPVVASLLVLQGCASMSEQECYVADWHAIGFEDGARGARAESIGKYRKACADAGVTPDLTAYRAGRMEGLRLFCTGSNGFSLGSRGGNYNGVCAGPQEAEFVSAYQAGRKLHELNAAVNDLNNRIARKRKEIDSQRDVLTETEAALVSDDTPATERVRLLAEARQIAERQGELEAQITQLERKLALKERALDRYRAQLAYDTGEYYP